MENRSASNPIFATVDASQVNEKFAAVSSQEENESFETVPAIDYKRPQVPKATEELSMEEILMDGVTFAMQNPKSFFAMTAATTGVGALLGNLPGAIAGLFTPLLSSEARSAYLATTEDTEDFRYQAAETERDFKNNTAFDQSFAEGLSMGTLRADKKSEVGLASGQFMGLVLLTATMSAGKTVDASNAAPEGLFKSALKSNLPMGLGMGIQSTVQTTNDSLDMGRSAEDTAILATVNGVSSFAGNMVGFGLLPVASTSLMRSSIISKAMSPIISKVPLSKQVGKAAVSGAEFSAYGVSENITEYLIGKSVDTATGKDLYKDAKITMDDVSSNFGFGFAFSGATQTLSGFLGLVFKKPFQIASRVVSDKMLKNNISKGMNAEASSLVSKRAKLLELKQDIEFNVFGDAKMSKDTELKYVKSLTEVLSVAENKDSALVTWIKQNMEEKHVGEHNIKILLDQVWR